MLKTDAIQKFLNQQPYPLGKLYTPEMEVQVNVSKDNGETISGTFSGRGWHGFTDGFQTWMPFRIPWNAGTNPQYTDKEIKFDISEHALAIGMTGWNYIDRKSMWVGFDFDSLIGHKEGLSDDELSNIRDKLSSLEFINIYSSTSGLGLHIYIYLDIEESINTHTEHAAIARSLLNKISALTGLELDAKVDCMGGNMWVWHRRAAPGISFKCIKQGCVLKEIPANWRDYLQYVTKGRVSGHNTRTDVDTIVASKNKIQLDDDHTRLLKWFEASDAMWWYDDVKQMLVCHTYDLKQAHFKLSYKGFFDTISEGKEHGQDQNCFAFPLDYGGWVVRRHTRNCREHKSWHTDRSGWTCIYFNRLPSLRTASQLMGGVEGEKAYSFKTLETALKTLISMGIDYNIETEFKDRQAYITRLKDDRIKVTFEGTASDSIEGWSQNKSKTKWERIFFHPQVNDEISLPDELVRHVTIAGVEHGWRINTNHRWIGTGRPNVISTLLSCGFKRTEIENTLGQCILNNWRQVVKPFQPEYPGNREWNKNSPQYRFLPSEGTHPTWDLILEHCGKGLDEALNKNDWAQNNGILTGSLYLQAWAASIFQFPNDPLPFLFLCGPQNCGKSIFHESLSLLLTNGYVRADQALTNQSGFNGELGNAIICIVEETNLSKRSFASDRIKDWVTGRTISIRKMYKEPYETPNLTHWIQCANDSDYCPILPGDTRITMLTVRCPDKDIPKPTLLSRCDQEGPAFISTLLRFELPEQEGRLRIPVIETEHKIDEMDTNKTDLEIFIEDKVFQIPGSKILFSDFFNEFVRFLEPTERINWTPRKTSKKIGILKGKAGGKGQLYLANVSLEKDTPEGVPLTRENGRLV